VDTLIEQGIKDGTLNGLSEKWLKGEMAATTRLPVATYCTWPDR
jgi:lambda repressor-like predicted transcriptional regulator